MEKTSRVAITPFERNCWSYSKSGSDITVIATLMNSTPEEVTQAVTAVERWKASNSMEMVVASMNEQAMIAMEPVGRTLAEAQAARRLVSPEVVNPKTGEILRDAVYMPDYSTQIAATEAVARIVESVRERGPGVQVNVGGNQLHLNGGGGRSFEERLRIQREARGMRQADMSTGAAVDGVTIDANTAGSMKDGSADGDDDDGDEIDDDYGGEDEDGAEDGGDDDDADED